MKWLLLIIMAIPCISSCEKNMMDDEYKELMRKMHESHWEYRIPYSAENEFRDNFPALCKYKMLKYLELVNREDNQKCQNESDCCEVPFPCFGCTIPVNNRIRNQLIKEYDESLLKCMTAHCAWVKCVNSNTRCKNGKCIKEIDPR